MFTRKKTNSLFGFLAGCLLSLRTKRKSKVSSEDLERLDFPTSTQRVGIRFTERMRDVFRLRWLRKI